MDMYIQMPTLDILRLKGSMDHKYFKNGKQLWGKVGIFGSTRFWLDAEPWHCGLKLDQGTSLSNEVDAMDPQQLALLLETLFSCLLAFVTIVASWKPGRPLSPWFQFQRLQVDLPLHWAQPGVTWLGSWPWAPPWEVVLTHVNFPSKDAADAEQAPGKWGAVAAHMGLGTVLLAWLLPSLILDCPSLSPPDLVALFTAPGHPWGMICAYCCIYHSASGI